MNGIKDIFIKELFNFSYLLGEPYCYFCNCKIDSGLFICSECLKNFENIIKNYNRCPVCSAVLINNSCNKFHHNNLENVFSLIPLNDTLYQNYLDAKYRKNKNKLLVFKYLLNKFLPEDIIAKYSSSVDYITYVPISINKKLIRGYNPSYIFAKIISRKIKKPLIHIFREKGLRYFHIERENINIPFSDRFILKRKKFLENKSILIVDDIYTTGKTASYLADLLLYLKISKVYLFTIFNHR